MLGWVGEFDQVSGILEWRLCGPVLRGISWTSREGRTNAVVLIGLCGPKAVSELPAMTGRLH